MGGQFGSQGCWTATSHHLCLQRKPVLVHGSSVNRRRVRGRLVRGDQGLPTVFRYGTTQECPPLDGPLYVHGVEGEHRVGHRSSHLQARGHFRGGQLQSAWQHLHTLQEQRAPTHMTRASTFLGLLLLSVWRIRKRKLQAILNVILTHTNPICWLIHSRFVFVLCEHNLKTICYP